MTRPGFDVYIGANLTTRIVSPGTGEAIFSETVSDAHHSTETVFGISRRKPAGWIPPTPYTMIYRRLDLAEGVSRISSSADDFLEYTGCLGGGIPWDSQSHFDGICHSGQLDAHFDSLKQAVLVRCRSNLKQSDINLGVAFAERNATARLLGDTATSMAKAYRNLRNGNVRRAMEDLGISSRRREPRGSNAPQKWLEMQYGWKPLLSDVYGACDALSKRSMDHWIVTAKASKILNEDYSHSWDDFSMGKGGAKVLKSVFGRIDAIPSNEVTISLASMGITNPLLVAWELVPFSFVVDWALPVGGWLDSLDASLGYTSCWYSESALTRADWIIGGVNGSYGGANVDNQYVEKKKFVRIVRTVFPDIPLPAFPGLKDPISLGHMANGLSLLATAFGRK